MLSVLVEGTLIAAPVRRTSAKGSAFVTAQVRCHADDGESIFCSVIAFQAQTAEALDCAPGTVKSRTSRGLAALRDGGLLDDDDRQVVR